MSKTVGSSSCGDAEWEKDALREIDDIGLREQLRTFARQNPRHGFRRARAGLRFGVGDMVDKKKVHRL